MMGTTPPSEYGSLYDLLALVKDNAEYVKRVAELDAKVRDAQRILDQATETNRTAEANKKLAADLLEKANQKHAEALALKKEQEAKAADTSAREGKLSVREADHAKKVAAHAEAVREAQEVHAAREAALAAQARDLAGEKVRLAQIKVDQERLLAVRKEKAEVEAQASAARAALELETAGKIRAEADKIRDAINKKRLQLEAFFERK